MVVRVLSESLCAESHRHDAGNYVGRTVESNGFADDLAIRSEMMPPQPVAEDYRPFAILAELLQRESLSRKRRYPNEWQEILRYEGGVDLFRRRPVPLIAQVVKKNAIGG